MHLLKDIDLSYICCFQRFTQYNLFSFSSRRVWSVRYNHFHDQLLLSSSSDSRVTLLSIPSLSSEPYGHLDDDEDNEDEQKLVKACSLLLSYLRLALMHFLF